MKNIKSLKIDPEKACVDAKRPQRTPRTFAISVSTICVRMLGLREADSIRDPGPTLASATLTQKAADKSCPKHENIIEISSKIDARLTTNRSKIKVEF